MGDENGAVVSAPAELVAVKMLVSEAGLGFRTGEIRGFSKEVAEKLIASKMAAKVDV